MDGLQQPPNNNGVAQAPGLAPDAFGAQAQAPGPAPDAFGDQAQAQAPAQVPNAFEPQEPQLSQPTSSSAQATDSSSPSILSNVGSSLSNVSSSVKDMATSVKGMFGNTKTLVIVGAAILAAIVATIVAYVLYYIISTNITNRKKYLLPDTKIPLAGTVFTGADAGGVPASGNGKRMTMSFWIYINDINAYRGLYRHILHRGDKGLQGASPLIYLDANVNKIYVRFEINAIGNQSQVSSITTPYAVNTEISSANKEQWSTVQPSTISALSPDAAIQLDLMSRGVVIDYIPLQRWVHVGIVVNEEINMGTITVYLDGELVKVVSSDKYETLSVTKVVDASGSSVSSPSVPSNKVVQYNFQNLNLDKGGNVWVGGNPQDASIGPGFDGLVSSVLFANYDMNAKDIFDVYMSGPVDNILTKLGLPAYGVRSPVYRIA